MQQKMAHDRVESLVTHQHDIVVIAVRYPARLDTIRENCFCHRPYPKELRA